MITISDQNYALRTKQSPSVQTQGKTGAQLLVEALLRQGVTTVFGYPGGAILPLYDALYEAPIHHVLTRHEQAAAFAADAYARVTGKVGVCISTSGPGATNLITGIANSYMDSVPLVAITGQVALPLIGRDSFQEADMTGITMPITKHNYLVKDLRDLPEIVEQAFLIASHGRPGPVLIDLPKDVASAKATEEEIARYRKLHSKALRPSGVERLAKGPPRPNHAQLKKAIQAIMSSSRPVIIAGGGIIKANACNELVRFAETIYSPVALTLMGLGCLPSDHELCVGMLGMHGTVAANTAVMEADLIIALGIRFDDRVTGKTSEFAPKAKIIHVDIDPAEIGKNIDPTIPIVGDLKETLSLLLEMSKSLPALRAHHEEWVAELKELRSTRSPSYSVKPDASESSRIKPQQVVEEVSRLTSGKAIITTDVGQHQMWTALYYKFTEPRTLVSSGGLGAMGYGLPAGIGAQIGRPDRLVVVMAGDGSLQMNIQELATIVQEKLPIKIVLFENTYLGMVRQWQELFHNKRYSQVKLKNPDFVKVAEAYGIKGIRVTHPSKLTESIVSALSFPGPVLVDVPVVEEENVYPMVAPGQPLSNIMESPS